MTEQQPELLPNQIEAISPEDQARRDKYRQRFSEFVNRQMRGHDSGTTRLTLER